ncbi:beta-N-acetylhexosaminidase [Pseudoclavibacter endophyticus]|uniref:beta-N-acetylhexosaminidase n=1 Tax=Pseudoclavibacter endophyticus TaxID=1778590 RepID=UPI00166EAF4F|nr:glycoside hydrolase family 20 protein [Pseudoclavibacter endophyticus]
MQPPHRRVAARSRAATLVALGALFGAILAPLPGGAAVSASAAPAPPQNVPALVPQPTAVVDADGEWRPDATTRILIVTEQPELFPAQSAPPHGLTGAPADGAVPDTEPSTAPERLAAEAARLAAELVALDVMTTPPELHTVTPLEAEDVALPTDIRLRTTSSTLAEPPDGQPDEAGRLEIDAETGVALSARTDTGLFRASRALLQLLTAHGGEAPAGLYDFVPATEVRSVHLDIARKTYSLEFLKQLVDELAWNGLNELELHVSEFEGFALESTTHPGIQSPTVLSQAQLRELLAYAEAQHVTVTPSLDMPGHLEHVLEALPQYRLLAADGSPVYGALDITNPEAIAFARELIAEYAAIFEPGQWNLGADEFVDFDDDGEVALLTAAARAAYGPDATAFDAMTAFVNETATFLADLGFTTRVWSDGMLRASIVELDPAIEVAHWTRRPPGSVPAAAFADAGHRLINVNDEYLYFVLGERVGYAYPTGEAILDEWRPTLLAGDDAVSPDAIEGAMFAIWSDIPEALTEDEVLERARLPIQAMSVRSMNPDAQIAFSDLVDAAVAIGPAPAGLSGVHAAPIAPPDLPSVDAGPSAPAEETEGAAAISNRLLLTAGVVVATIAVIVMAVLLVVRFRRVGAGRDERGSGSGPGAGAEPGTDTDGLPTRPGGHG